MAEGEVRGPPRQRFVSVIVQFLRQCDEVMFWINDKETFVTIEELGNYLEHVEVQQRKFDEFLLRT